MEKARYCDDPACDRDADFMYVWPGTETRYAGCTKHATQAKHAVANMGRELQLIPLVDGADPGGNSPAPAAAPLSSAALDRAAERMEDAAASIARSVERLGEMLSRFTMSAQQSGAGAGAGAGTGRTTP